MSALPAPRRNRDPRLASSLSVVPGLGQLYNGEVRKALFFLLATAGTLGPAVLLIMLGEGVGRWLLDARHGAAFLLVAFASILVFLGLFLLGLAFWASAVIDARRRALELRGGRPGTGRWWFLHLS